MSLSGALELPELQARASMREQVGHALRAALVAGQMRAGVVYSAPALAAQFGVSATPVREALLDLAKDGLVVAVPNKGFRVTELSTVELDDLSAIRALLEVPTIAELARQHDAAIVPELEALRSVARRIVTSAERGQLVDYIELDRQFHLTLLRLAGNAHLVQVVGELRDRSRLYGLKRLAAHDALGESAREHEQMLDLVLAGDSDGAEALMRRHIGHVRGRWAGDE